MILIVINVIPVDREVAVEDISEACDTPDNIIPVGRDVTKEVSADCDTPNYIISVGRKVAEDISEAWYTPDYFIPVGRDRM